MNQRQSLAGFNFQQYNKDFLARAKTSTNGNANDADEYEVRIVPAAVEAGGSYWRVIGVRHLTPSENTGKHNLYAEVLDEEGNRIHDNNLRLQRGWEGQHPDETPPIVQFDKGDNEPATNIPIDGGQRLWVQIDSELPSDKVENLHTKHADERGPNGEIWNSVGHHSFYVVFQRTRAATVDTPVVITPASSGNDSTYLESADALPALAPIQPSQPFTQSWRLLNSGNRPWDATYRLMHVGGSALGAPPAVPLVSCDPGHEITIQVPFVAAGEPGPYVSIWRTATPQGEAFGERLWLVIVVPDGTEGVSRADGRNVRPSSSQEVATPRLPNPAEDTRMPPGQNGIVRDPELNDAWKKHIIDGFANNQVMFKELLEGFMNPYWTTVWMYRILFGLGVASFLVAAGLSAFTNKDGYILVFGGLSALSLLAYFFNRPLQALEENIQFITWLGLIYNSYWSRLVYLNSQPDVQQGIQDATDDAIARLKDLMAAHAERSGKRPTLS